MNELPVREPIDVETNYGWHQSITNNIINQLNEGTVPWQTSWLAREVPQNLLTGRPYRGINLLLLTRQNYQRNLFLTESQLHRLGGHVLPNELPELVLAERSEKRLYPYYVFNVGQCKISPELIPGLLPKDDPLSICHRIIAHMPNRPRIIHNNRQLFYMIETDVIDMPEQGQYDCAMGFCADVFMALVASTAHKTRLDRSKMAERSKNDSVLYELELLVREIGCWYLKSVAGIESKIYTSEAYCRHWAKVLKNNSQFIFTACSLAQEAVEYILGVPFDECGENDYFEDDLLPF